MKSETELRSNLNSNLNHSNANLSNGHNTNPNVSNHTLSNSHGNGNIFSGQRKSAVHDLTQVLIEDCQKLMAECHKSISKYHNLLVVLSNGFLNDTINKDELRSLRKQNYSTIKVSLDKLLPQIDQVNFNNDNELYNSIQQIIAFLEYLKLEFTRHFYIIKSYSMQNDTSSQIFVKNPTHDPNIVEPLVCNEATKRLELIEIQNDIYELDLIVHRLTQKYYIFVPDLNDIKTWNKKGGKNLSNLGSFNLFSKCKFICCFCSPKYI